MALQRLRDRYRRRTVLGHSTILAASPRDTTQADPNTKPGARKDSSARLQERDAKKLQLSPGSSPGDASEVGKRYCGEGVSKRRSTEPVGPLAKAAPFMACSTPYLNRASM